jgi:hypothetical protein
MTRWADDDSWSAKTDLLCADPVPWAGVDEAREGIRQVSFTFGLPDRDTVARLRRRAHRGSEGRAAGHRAPAGR